MQMDLRHFVNAPPPFSGVRGGEIGGPLMGGLMNSASSALGRVTVGDGGGVEYRSEVESIALVDISGLDPRGVPKFFQEN